jgi:signal transduction histidine kinase
VERAAARDDAGSSAVLALGEDRDGDLWIGTETAGVQVLRKRLFQPLAGSPDSADHPPTSVVQTAGGAIWVGTNGAGVTRIGSGDVHTYTSERGLTSDTVLALAAGGTNPEDVWVGTPDGLSAWHDGRWRSWTSSDGLVDDLVRSLLVTRDGAVWIGSRHGATRWKDGRGSTLTTAQGLGSDVVGPMLEDAAGDLWIGTSGGLARLRAGAVRNYTERDGLPGDIVAALDAAHDGGFWIAIDGRGLARWDGSRFVSFADVSTIPREINALVDDGAGSLWVSSAHGIFRIPVAGLERYATDRKSDISVVAYGPADGLTSVESGGMGYPAAWRLNDGRVALATRRGVVVADSAAISRNRAPPAVNIEEVSIDGRSGSSEDLQSIAPGASHFVFSFAGIHLAAPQHVQYRYMLDGLDHDWVQAGTRRTAYYTNIPHGRYAFRVAARNAGGPWSESVDLPLNLRPHVYETAWFRGLLVLGVALLGFATYRLRVRALHSRFAVVSAERNRLAREIHDTLAQSFVAVSVRLEVMAQMLRGAQGVNACREQLNETRALVRDSLAEARRSIWDLRAEGDAARSLPARLSAVVQQARQRVPDAEFVTGGTYRALEHAMEDELFRIGQEAVNNVVRHAHAESLRVHLEYGIESLWLDVADTGRGFDPAQAASRKEGHYGLTGIRERARILKADVMLESGPGRGTRLRVTVPLPREGAGTGEGG